MKSIKTAFSLSILLFIWLNTGTDANAQGAPNIELDVQANEILTNAQIIELTNFAFDERGTGPRLLNFSITNNETFRVNDLYLDFQVVSDRRGLIVEAYQRDGRPFSMQAGQTVFASNNAVARGQINGIEESLRLDGDLTSRGEDLINSLQGRTTLPVDEYRIVVEIFHGGNRFNGTRVASASAVIGTNLIEEDLSIFLQTPGDVVGSDMTITNNYPEFRWEGIPGQTYRVIVVEEQRGENAETLIESARSTPAARLGQSASLLDFENADVLVVGNSFQYPSSGVQPLQEGKRYFWQVSTNLITTSGEEVRSSEIWSFKLDSGTRTVASDDLVEISEEVQQVLVALLGSQQFGDLMSGNYKLESIDLDGTEFPGEMAKEELLKLIEKIQEGKIKVVN